MIILRLEDVSEDDIDDFDLDDAIKRIEENNKKYLWRGKR